MLLYIMIGSYVVSNVFTFVFKCEYRSRGYYLPALWCIAFFLPFTLRNWTYSHPLATGFAEYGAILLCGLFTLSAVINLIREFVGIIQTRRLFRSISADTFVDKYNRSID